MPVLNEQQKEVCKLQPSLKELLPRWETGFLISVFAIGFFVTLLSIAMMVSDAKASEVYCREYRTEITIAGQQQDAYGTACRRPDGTWQIQTDRDEETRLALIPIEDTAALPTVIVARVPTDEAEFFDGEVVVVEDWPDKPEFLFYEGSATHVIIDEGEEDGIFIIEEQESVVILENEDDEEIIILD